MQNDNKPRRTIGDPRVSLTWGAGLMLVSCVAFFLTLMLGENVAILAPLFLLILGIWWLLLAVYALLEQQLPRKED